MSKWGLSTEKINTNKVSLMSKKKIRNGDP